MAKIGLFGCTADPFTLAHREIVKQALEQGLVDTIWICPTIVTWHRSNYVPWLNDEDKINVIYKMTEGMQAYVYQDDLRLRSICKGNKILEDRFVHNHRFIDTLVDFKSSYSFDDDRFYVIIGSDEYENFESWYAYDSILKQCDGLIVVTDQDGNGRDGKPIAKKEDPLFKNTRFLKIDNKFNDVSATAMRKKYTSYISYTEDMANEINGKAPDEVICKTPIFDVVKGYKHANGLKPIKIKAPDWVMIITEVLGDFIVEKQFRYGANGYVEEFPCGMVEDDETPLDAAARELEEETGYKVSKEDFIELGCMNPNPAFMMNKMHLFYVKLDFARYEKTQQKLDAHEQIEVEFVEKYEFIEKVKANAMDGKQPAMLMSALWLYEKI